MPAARSAYHHGDLKRVLVDAAIALVAEGQNWDFSLREVARRAGVSHNAPYNHFADKRDLLAAVAAAGYEALRARMVAAGVVINGLCVLHEEADLLESYEREVIGGSGSFAVTCSDYAGFADAMRRKLLAEITGMPLA